MNNLNKKQKIILIILICITIGAISYYIYEKDSNITIEEQKQESSETTIKKEEEKGNKIIVHVSGAVNKEGIVELEEDSRISDAIEKAGGLKQDANMKEINLAYKLEDGMKIYIPNINEIENTETDNQENMQKYIREAEEISENTGNNKKESKVNINKATKEELDTLPGIGPSTANKIISYREENGDFKNIEEIKEVSGIGESKFEKIKDLIIAK